MVADGEVPPVSTTTGADFDSGRGASFSSSDRSGFAEAAQNVVAAWAALQRYLSAQADRLKLAVRTVLLLTIAGVLALVFAAGIFVTAAVLLMVGTADGISILLGGRQWAGDLVTGGGVVLAVATTGYFVVGRMSRASRQRTMASYQSTRIPN